MQAATLSVAQGVASVAGVNGTNLPKTREEAERAAQSPYGLHALVQLQMDAPRPGAAGLIDWYQMRSTTPTTAIFLDRLFEALDAMPKELRTAEFVRILNNIEPSLDADVRREATYLVRSGATPRRALRAALGALLAARRKKHFRVVQSDIIPLQARKAAEGVFEATSDVHERARRVALVVEGLLPAQRPPYDPEQSRVRLREMGLSTAQVEQVMSTPFLTPKDVEDAIAEDMQNGVPPVDAVTRGLEMALRAFFLDVVKTNGVGNGVEFCGAIIGGIVAGVSVLTTIIGTAVPLARQAKAERRARDAETRQRNAPLMTGEVENLVGQMLQDPANTRWTDRLRTITLDYVRVNRPGRTAFVANEARQVQEAFERLAGQRRTQQQAQERQARQAQQAQQQAEQQAQQQATSSKNTKIAIGVAVGAVVIIGGALVYRAKK